ncbi:hypothetical protein FQA39_LY07551 [Lamprigera yunnana]|nr:hypothetical protein FQA39_LY07551 [Lamprigera yunnana]
MPREEQDLKIYKSPPTGCELHVSLFDIAPISVIKKKASNRGRKACKSQVITSSPYKNDLEQSLSTPKKPPLKRKVFPKPQPTRGASKKQKKSDADSNEDSNAANESFVPADDDMDIDDIGQIVPDDKDTTCLFCDATPLIAAIVTSRPKPVLPKGNETAVSVGSTLTFNFDYQMTILGSIQNTKRINLIYWRARGKPAKIDEEKAEEY